jgi:PPOX class probable F420-dependent enzyme
MPVIIPESHRDLLERPIVVTLATITPSGQPHLTAIWRYFDGTYLIFITSVGLQKEKNMRANPLVGVMTLDPQNSGRYLEIRGIVADIIEEGAIAQLDQITRLYTGKLTYYGHIVPLSSKGQRTHVICKIKPIKVVARG